MANYDATSRSNYFKVKDFWAFTQWVKTVPGLRYFDRRDDCDPKTFGIYAYYGAWPMNYETPESDDPAFQDGVEINWVRDLGAHLADGEVCIMMSVGNEKLRYVCGDALAFDNTGKTISLDLSDIYAKAEQAFGVTPTVAEY